MTKFLARRGFVSREGKNWIPERYATVLDVASREYGLQPVIVGSEAPSERAAAEHVARLARTDVAVDLKNDLRRLAWLLDGCALMLSPDTGPLHIASALGTPVIGLYGYTDPKRVGPYGRSADLVIDRFTRPGETAATPGFRRGNMERISAEDVLEKLDLAVRKHL